MTPDMQAKFRDMRLQCGRNGLRQPVQVMPGNYALSEGVCPWFDAQKRAAE